MISADNLTGMAFRLSFLRGGIIDCLIDYAYLVKVKHERI